MNNFLLIVRAPQSANATENELAKYDTITLSDKTVTAKKATTDSAAQTADPIALTVAAAAVAAAGVVVSKKRK